MEQITSTINEAIALSGLMLCALGSVVLFVMQRVDKKTLRFFQTVLICLATYILSNFIGLLIDGRTQLVWVVLFRITVFLEFACGYLLVLLVSVYLLRFVESGERYRRLRLLLLCYFALELLLLVVSQFTGLYYSFGSDNYYRRNPDTYWITSVLSILILLLDLGIYYVNFKKLSRDLRYAFGFYLILPLIGMVLQNFFYELHIPIMLAILCTMVMFIYVLHDQTEKSILREQENAEMREAIMLSQIQPHFLFNSLGAIRELCLSDPAKAEEAIVRFSQYLRGNMDSLQAGGSIGFSDELNHTRNYLELEQLRFGKMLQVEYDIRAADFRLPALTLQPIVENAVRHGVRKNEDGGVVRISTREEAKSFVVQVEDNGPGFDPGHPPTDGKSHIGIQNVRSRLEQMCSGSLEIDSRPGRGTCVRIRIPKEGDK